MPKCVICGEEEKETLYKCSDCGKMFCSWCGQTVPPLCIDCSEDQDNEDDEDWLDKLIWRIE